MSAEKAVILARVSSKSQEDEGYSLDSQIKLLVGYCERHEFQIEKIFKIAETASKQQSRIVFHEMLDYLSAAGITHLTIEKTDRFTRNFRDAVAIDDWLEGDETRRLHAVKENMILHKNAKSDVKFMWNIHLSVAKKYSDNLREEAMKGWAEKLAQGWLPASPPPGYKTVLDSGKRIHVPDPDIAPLMIKVFKSYLLPAESIGSTTQKMFDLGIRTRMGKPYAKSHVQRIMTNPFYVGINRFNGVDYPGAQTPILSKMLFDAVQQKMHGKRPRQYKKHQLPLQGMIRCNDCGSVITWQLQKGKYYGVCRRLTDACKQSKMLREDDVHDLIANELNNLVCPDPAIIDWVCEQMQSQHAEIIKQRELMEVNINGELKKLETMEESLYDDKLAGVITKEKYNSKHELFQIKATELKKSLSELDKNLSQRLDQRIAIMELTQMAGTLYAKMTPAHKRLIISKLFAQLTVEGGSLSVKYSKFVLEIARRVQKTRNLLEAQI